MAVRCADCTRRQHLKREASETRFAQTADASLSVSGAGDASPSNGDSLQRQPRNGNGNGNCNRNCNCNCNRNGRCAGNCNCNCRYAEHQRQQSLRGANCNSNCRYAERQQQRSLRGAKRKDRVNRPRYCRTGKLASATYASSPTVSARACGSIPTLSRSASVNIPATQLRDHLAPLRKRLLHHRLQPRAVASQRRSQRDHAHDRRIHLRRRIEGRRRHDEQQRPCR